MSDDRYDAGLNIRKAVLGEAHVQRASLRATDLDGAFQELITRYVWGSVWTREGLSKRDRSLITIAMLAALGHRDELRLHLAATRNTGVSLEEVREVLLQVAVYAGVPAANAAFQDARQVLQPDEAPAATQGPTEDEA